MLHTLTAISLVASTFITPHFSDVRQAVDDAHSTTGETLVVFDLDNTILATDTAFGSEHWFLWQSELITAGNPDVATNVNDLLAVQAWIYAVAPIHATEARISSDLQSFASRGIKAMALTSRNLDVRDATLRELARNGLDMTAMAPGPAGGYPGSYRPEGVPSPKDVIYEHGVMLTQGQNKGLMLRALLEKTGYAPQAIVFVDDRAHHLANVQAAFADRPELVTTIQLTHEVPKVEAFKASDKSFEKAQWCAFAAGLSSVYPQNPPFIPCTSFDFTPTGSRDPSQ